MCESEKREISQGWEKMNEYPDFQEIVPLSTRIDDSFSNCVFLTSFSGFFLFSFISVSFCYFCLSIFLFIFVSLFLFLSLLLSLYFRLNFFVLYFGLIFVSWATFFKGFSKLVSFLFYFFVLACYALRRCREVSSDSN